MSQVGSHAVAVTSPGKSMVDGASKGRGIGRGNFYRGIVFVDRPTEVQLGIYINSFYSISEQTMVSVGPTPSRPEPSGRRPEPPGCRLDQSTSDSQQTTLILVDHGVKFSEAYYLNVMVLPQFLMSSQFFIFQQDSAPANTTLCQSTFLLVTSPDVDRFFGDRL